MQMCKVRWKCDDMYINSEGMALPRATGEEDILPLKEARKLVMHGYVTIVCELPEEVEHGG